MGSLYLIIFKKYLQYFKHPDFSIKTVLFIVSFLIIALCLRYDLEYITTDSFRRSGDIVLFLGAVIALEGTLVTSFKGSVSSRHVIDGGEFGSTDFDDEIRKHEISVLGVWAGTSLALIGSIVSGYGDLIVNYLHIFLN